VQVDEFGKSQAFAVNAELEFLRNKERYAFLRWGQDSFRNMAIRSAGHRNRSPG
jgi:aconitate hydratase